MTMEHGEKDNKLVIFICLEYGLHMMVHTYIRQSFYQNWRTNLSSGVYLEEEERTLNNSKANPIIL